MYVYFIIKVERINKANVGICEFYLYFNGVAFVNPFGR